jgi:shikimate dehydrogenase
VADSTDGAGFMANLRATVPGFSAQARIVAVLGAGGAARAIVHALLEDGAAQVRLLNRTRDRGEAIAHHFGPRVQPLDWGRRVEAARDAVLLVNTTSLGMQGNAPLDMDVSALAPGCIVSDIVYVPLATPLLTAAAARGLPTVDGLGMLLHQAVPGFEKWFGVRPTVTDELRALIVRDIESG